MFWSSPREGEGGAAATPRPPGWDRKSSGLRRGRTCPARGRVGLLPVSVASRKANLQRLFVSSRRPVIHFRETFSFLPTGVVRPESTGPFWCSDSAADRGTGSPETDRRLSRTFSQQGPAFLGQNPRGVGRGGEGGGLSSKASRTGRAGRLLGPSGLRAAGKGLPGLRVSPDVHFVIQVLGHVRLLATPWTAAHQASLSITISWSSLKPMSVESVMPSNRLTLCRHLLLPPSVFPGIGSFQMSRLLALCALKSLNFLTHGMQIPETSVPARKISDG